ncbi:MAG: hypothetical protein FWF97_04615 [Alphaproteobacteria bacterium]|nr:hypothetical protein [Alphaproteobacteria bacterium]
MLKVPIKINGRKFPSIDDALLDYNADADIPITPGEFRKRLINNPESLKKQKKKRTPPPRPKDKIIGTARGQKRLRTYTTELSNPCKYKNQDYPSLTAVYWESDLKDKMSYSWFRKKVKMNEIPDLIILQSRGRPKKATAGKTNYDAAKTILNKLEKKVNFEGLNDTEKKLWALAFDVTKQKKL